VCKIFPCSQYIPSCGLIPANGLLPMHDKIGNVEEVLEKFSEHLLDDLKLFDASGIGTTAYKDSYHN
jgi:hypothetical protein